MVLIYYIFPLTLILTGLMAGIHFSNIMGYLPALRQVDAQHIIRFWKKADEYFGRRMPVFGCSLLICQLSTIVLLSKYHNSFFFWILVFGFVLVFADLIIAIKINTPVNNLLRAWNEEAIPENFEAMREQALAGFYGRATAAILSFLALVISYVLWCEKF
jgi:uncharacterized membrane protein